MENLSIILTATALLIALTNIISEVIKKLFEKVPAQIIVTISAVILTLVAVIGFCIYKQVAFQWYYAVIGILGGIIVSYGAMYGYDNLYKQIAEALSKGDKKSEE